ncbi:MAG: hypothetical protein JXR49_22385 [Acidobacteria bacterium]|nr:hypothetical protein [Acidobacteriota bacterium]
MTGTTQKKAKRVIGLITVTLVLLGVNAFAFQGGISPLSDYMYKKDYQKYEDIRKETDTQKRADLLVAFLKERPISRVLNYVATDYIACISKLANNDAARKISMQEALWDLVPTDQEIKAAEIPVGVEEFRKTHLIPTRKLILTSMAAGYYQTNNFAKAAELAEQAYAIAPDKTLVQTLFDIYNKLKNEDKIIAYGKKMLDAFPMSQPQGYATALQLAQIYLQKQNIAEATRLFTKLMDVYGNSVPPNITEANWNTTRIFAYTLMAKDAYSKNDYAKAEKLFQTVLSFNSRLDEPYYYLGMCKWKTKDQPAAIVYFARCSVLKKDYADRASKYLEDLYKATYPNEPDGLQDVIDKAKSDLSL